MKTLFLDDSEFRCRLYRSVYPSATIVRTAAEAIQALECKKFWTVSLDHDLGGREMVDSNDPETGFEVVRWIIAHRPLIGVVAVHSYNVPAAQRMIQALRDAGYSARYEPFSLYAQEIKCPRYEV